MKRVVSIVAFVLLCARVTVARLDYSGQLEHPHAMLLTSHEDSFEESL